MSRCRFTIVVVLVAVAVLVAACSGGDSNEIVAPGTTSMTRVSRSTTTTSAETTAVTSERSEVERQIVDRYKAFWEARFEANQAPPDPADPRLAEYATGRQLDNVIAETQARRDDGLAIRRPSNSIAEQHVRLTAIDGDVATLQDCAVDDGIIYRSDTGEVVNDDVVTQSVNASMRLVDGEWKLERASLVQEWQGVAGCALAED